MKQVFSTSKGISVLDVPAPLLDKDSILVETHYSFISSGTEMATLKEMEPKGLSDNIVKTKERLVKLIKFLNEKGIKKTISILSDRIKDDDLSSSRLVPIGYCCSGIVVAIGDGVSNFNVGDKVACAGAGKATHSELVVVGVRAIDEFVVKAEQMANDITTEHTYWTSSEALRPVGAERIGVVLKGAAISRGKRGLVRVDPLQIGDLYCVGAHHQMLAVLDNQIVHVRHYRIDRGLCSRRSGVEVEACQKDATIHPCMPARGAVDLVVFHQDAARDRTRRHLVLPPFAVSVLVSCSRIEDGEEKKEKRREDHHVLFQDAHVISFGVH